MKAPLRSKSIGTKVTEEEYARLEQAASERRQSISECCRDALLSASQPGTSAAEPVVLAEVLALRTILLNLFFRLGQGEAVAPGNDNLKFATYTRDAATGLDYADQRYYASQFGRFMTADPYRASGGPGDPGSWNRYSYVGGDPINYIDPFGQDKCPAGTYNTCVDVSASVGPFDALNISANTFRVYLLGPIISKQQISNEFRARLALERALATQLSQMVTDGSANDCQALAAYADGLC